MADERKPIRSRVPVPDDVRQDRLDELNPPPRVPDERTGLRLSEAQVEELLTYSVERYGPNSHEARCCRDWQDMRDRLAAAASEIRNIMAGAAGGDMDIDTLRYCVIRDLRLVLKRLDTTTTESEATR